MTSIQLLATYHNYCAKHGWEHITRSNVINDADPTAFNYSMEEPILRKYGGFFSIASPWTFSTVQPCIRTGDFGRLKKSGSDCTHMTLFHMLPIAFSIAPDHTDYETRHKDAILRPLAFVTDELHLDIRRMRVSYFSGGDIIDVSQGRVTRDLRFAPDNVTRDACLAAGMTSDQLMPELSTNTFLCTSPVTGDFYAGYRYELYYQLLDGSLMEIGTGESIEWKQIVKDGTTVDVVPMEQTICLSVVGLERCLVAAGNLSSVAECDHIAPLIECCRNSGAFEPQAAFLLTDTLRTVHLIVSDGGVYSSLNHRLREHMRALLRGLTSSQDRLELTEQHVHALLQLNADKQPWLTELRSGVNNTLTELQKYRGRQ